MGGFVRVRREPVAQGRNRLAEDVLDPVGEEELHLVADVLGQVAQVLLVGRGQDDPSRMPARRAASTFSLMPPIGSTSPVSVISPVMAVSLRGPASGVERGQRRPS